MDALKTKTTENATVLYLEGLFCLAVYVMQEDERAAIRREVTLASYEMSSAAVSKLRRSIELDKSFLDAYRILVVMLMKFGKKAEAKKFLAKGLLQPIVTKYDKEIRNKLQWYLELIEN